MKFNDVTHSGNVLIFSKLVVDDDLDPPFKFFVESPINKLNYISHKIPYLAKSTQMGEI